MRWVTSGGIPLAEPCLSIVLTTFRPDVTWPKRE